MSLSTSVKVPPPTVNMLLASSVPTTKKVLKDGTVRAYTAQPIYTWTDPTTGKQKCRRIPKAAFKHVRELTLRYKGMKKLVARFEAAAVAENLDAASKKNSSR